MDWMTAIPIIFIVLIIITSSIKIVKEYERGVIFRLGRLLGAKVPASLLSFHLWIGCR
jgi:SPFH domain, Band 7 family protein